MGRKRDPKPERVVVTRYHTPDGRRCRADTPGAVKTTTESESYFARLRDPETGARVWVPLGTHDLGEAWRRLREVLDERASGVKDPYLSQAARPIAEHVEEWVSAVAAGGVTPKRIAMLRSRVGQLVEMAGWRKITDIRKSTCQQALAKLQTTPTRSGTSKTYGGRSAQTRNHYLSHARQFARWLHDEQRLRHDPLAGLKPVSVEGDRRHDRRCPGDEEVELLFAHLAGEWPDWPPKVRKGMSGLQRSLGYTVAMCTGLRANELRSLTPERIDLATGDIRLGAKASKRRRRDVQPLPAWLVERLRAWLESGGGLWQGFDAGRPGRLLEDDLKAAREGWIAQAPTAEERAARERSGVLRYEVATPDGPLFFDFHALRHWYITAIASQANVSPAVMQALARHSDPKLTLNVYSKARVAEVREAADKLRIPGAGGGGPPG